VSVGVATCPEDGDNVETLLRNSDAALYQAKAKGRNCIKSIPRIMCRCFSRAVFPRTRHKQPAARIKLYSRVAICVDDHIDKRNTDPVQLGTRLEAGFLSETNVSKRPADTAEPQSKTEVHSPKLRASSRPDGQLGRRQNCCIKAFLAASISIMPACFVACTMACPDR